ncbi:hypothetical protein BDV12DRAFT_91161 [Aspergillus spectabilis]
MRVIFLEVARPPRFLHMADSSKHPPSLFFLPHLIDHGWCLILGWALMGIVRKKNGREKKGKPEKKQRQTHKAIETFTETPLPSFILE